MDANKTETTVVAEREPIQTVQILTLRVHAGVCEQIRAAAKRDGKSLNEWANDALRGHLAAART